MGRPGFTVWHERRILPEEKVARDLALLAALGQAKTWEYAEHMGCSEQTAKNRLRRLYRSRACRPAPGAWAARVDVHDEGGGGVSTFHLAQFLISPGDKVKKRRMAAIMGLLRFDWMRRRGDFIRPRDVSVERWRAIDAGERMAYEMGRLR